MPKKTETKEEKKKTSKKEEIKEKLKVAEPTKFILHIQKCGTDTLSSNYKQIEHDNPVILGLKGVKIMSDNFAPNHKPFFEYLLACSILKGLEFDKTKLSKDIEEVADRIKNISLKNLKGGDEKKDG